MTAIEKVTKNYSKANESLMYISGGKFNGLLIGINSKSQLNSVRERILSDYSYNSFDTEGVEHLKIVLLFLKDVYDSLHSAWK